MPKLKKRSDHTHWGEFASASVLPSASGSPNTGEVSVGDLAFVTGEVNYQCISVVGSVATWVNTGYDGDAVHRSLADEFDTAPLKSALVGTDRLLIEDSESSPSSFAKKYTRISDIPSGDSVLHDDVAGEFNGVTEKAFPVDNDIALIEDSAASYAKKKVLLSKIHIDAIHKDVSGEISTIAEKLAPVPEDLVLVEDSEASNAKKRVQVSNLALGLDAFQKSVAGEIAALDAKVSPVSADVLLIEDSAGGTYDKKKILISSLPNVTDPNAIHDNEAGEIAAVASKGAPVLADYLLIEDSEDGNEKKSITFNALPGKDGIDTSAIHDDSAGEISSIAPKGTPVAADFLLIEDSEAGNVKKRITIDDLPAAPDANAIHDNVAGEINAIFAEQTTLATDDLFLIEDGTTLAKKKVQATNLKDFSAVHVNGTGEIAGLTEDSAPHNDDVVMVEDVSGGNVKRKVKLSKLLGGSGGSGAVISSNVLTAMGALAAEVVVGQTTYNGATGSSHEFKAILEPSVDGAYELRLYDRGPVAGPPEAAMLIGNVSTSSAGLQVLSLTLTATSSPTPDSDEIYDSDRMYEARVYISGVTGDKLYVGKATLEGV